MAADMRMLAAFADVREAHGHLEQARGLLERACYGHITITALTEAAATGELVRGLAWLIADVEHLLGALHQIRDAQPPEEPQA